MNLRSTMVIVTSVLTVSIILNLEPTNSLAIDSPLLADSEEENADFLALSDSYQRTEFRVNASELQCHGEECGNVAHALLSIAQRFIEPHVVLYSFRDNGKLQRHTRANDFQPTSDVSFLNATGRSRTNPSASDFYSAYFANNQVPNLNRQRGATLRTPAEPDTYDSTTGEVRRSKYSQANLLALADDSYAGGGTYSGPAYETTAYDSYGGGGGYGGGGYGGGGYGGYGGYGGHQCCGKKDSLLPLLVVGALGLLAFYLYLQSTTTPAGRRRRNADGSFSDELEDEEVMLDGSTWLSLIHELWEQDGVVDDPSCAQHTLCRMNYLAMSAPGQAGWAVSLSSMPLSYLLHNRHNGGFSMYMDAALLGRTGANCTSLFSSCPRLR